MQLAFFGVVNLIISIGGGAGGDRHAVFSTHIRIVYLVAML